MEVWNSIMGIGIVGVLNILSRIGILEVKPIEIYFMFPDFDLIIQIVF